MDHRTCVIFQISMIDRCFQCPGCENAIGGTFLCEGENVDCLPGHHSVTGAVQSGLYGRLVVDNWIIIVHNVI